MFLRARDGDTVNVRVDLGFGVSVEIAVRLIGLESWEPSGDTLAKAREVAATIDAQWAGAEVRLVPLTRGLDRYGRARGTILTQGGDLAEWLIARGLAWRVARPGRADPPRGPTP